MGSSPNEISNRLKESNTYKTTSNLEPVKIRLGTEGPAAQEPLSIPDAFQNTVKSFGNRPALAVQASQGLWNYTTYKEYHDISLHIAKVFIKLGLQARHSVGILAFNCPEWFYASMGAIHANGISVGIYTTNSSDAVHHVLENSRANIVVVDESKQMTKIREIKHKLPLLKAVIQLNEPFDETLREEEGYYRWSSIRAMKVDDQQAELDRRLSNIAVNECCTIVYTSGTTDMPKGVMLSHDNILWDSRLCGAGIEGLVPGEDSIVSFLPLSHVAALNADLYLSLQMANTVYFADRNALKGSLGKTLNQVRPTIFGAVPRVFEKIQEKMTAMEAETTYIKKSMLNWAKSCALDYWMEVMKGNNYEGLQYRLAKVLILNKVKRALGLDRVKGVFCGAAAISAETKSFFLSLDIFVMEIYGLSENFGGHTMCNRRVPDLETVGQTLHGAETKIYNPDEMDQGEICFRGRHVFMGYINDKEKTDETLDDEGWMHTGDLGYMDDNGFVYITGRLKELIITAGGENIPPVRIENLVKNELSILSNCFLVGEKMKYLTLLVTLKTEIDLESGEPLDQLHPETLRWLNEQNLTYKSVSEILAAGPCPRVIDEIQKAIDRYNAVAISNAQKIQKFRILPRDFSIPTGELGPTLKLKRREVVRKYADVIDELYKV